MFSFNEDIRWMIGRPKSFLGWCLFYYFRICWVVVAPIALLVVLIAFAYSMATSTLDYTRWIGDVSNFLPFLFHKIIEDLLSS